MQVVLGPEDREWERMLWVSVDPQSRAMRKAEVMSPSVEMRQNIHREKSSSRRMHGSEFQELEMQIRWLTTYKW